MARSSIGIALICLIAIAALPAAADPPLVASPTTALQIVLDTQQDALRELDGGNGWWHDTKERTWSVKRPFEPGTLDTTHTFVVTYQIDGVTVATWQVDTRAGTAVALP